ncbi:hypothetical protein GCM10022222_31800 [Amycolatopsis ultiminotia]|uniref:Uncharacterized protein n=1 Tax=Amycolatopsis ultiminotia TaxID=543629 RepID=A0ABP6W5K4_9PSEU
MPSGPVFNVPRSCRGKASRFQVFITDATQASLAMPTGGASRFCFTIRNGWKEPLSAYIPRRCQAAA